MITKFVPKASARKICAEHTAYSMALFLQGALHLEFKPDCEEMNFVTTFYNEDPSANTPAETLS
jgi:hypothetical protein